MFNRWLQENDFKYLDKHFGINQITSYGVTGYEELRQQVEDRQVRSAEAQSAAATTAATSGQAESAAYCSKPRASIKSAHASSGLRSSWKSNPKPTGQEQELARLRQGQTRWENTRLRAPRADPKAQ